MPKRCCTKNNGYILTPRPDSHYVFISGSNFLFFLVALAFSGFSLLPSFEFSIAVMWHCAAATFATGTLLGGHTMLFTPSQSKKRMESAFPQLSPQTMTCISLQDKQYTNQGCRLP